MSSYFSRLQLIGPPHSCQLALHEARPAAPAASPTSPPPICQALIVPESFSRPPVVVFLTLPSGASSNNASSRQAVVSQATTLLKPFRK